MGDAVAEAAQAKGVKWEIAENVWRWLNEQLKHLIIEHSLLGKITPARLYYTHGSYHGFNGIRKVLDKRATRVLRYAQNIDVLEYETYGEDREKTRWWEVEGTAGHLSGRTLVLYEGDKQNTYEFEEIFEQIKGEDILAEVRVNADPPVVWENPYKHYRVSATDDITRAYILNSLYLAVTEDINPEYGSDQARQDMEFWVAVRDSAERENTWVDLPITHETLIEQKIHEEYVRRYGDDPVTDKDQLLDQTYVRLSAMWAVAGWL